MIVAALAMALATVAGGSLAPGDPPLVHPGFAPAFVLSSDPRDSVAFEADSLVASPGGWLVTLHGGQVRQRPDSRSLFFRVRTPGRLAVLVDSIDAPPWSADAAQRALLDRHATAPSWPRALTSTREGFEIPRDWFRRAVLEVANGFTAPVRVTFVAFDSPDPREIARVAALQSVGVHATLPTGAPQTPADRAGPPSAEALRLTARIVGEARIDSRSGRVAR